MADTVYAVIDDDVDSDGETDSEREFTRLSVHPCQEDALAAMELFEGDRYLCLYNNGPRGHSSLWACTTHVECGKLMRMVQETGTDNVTTVALESSGVHTTEISTVKKAGIAHCMKREVDAMLLAAGPAKCLKELCKRHAANPIRLRLMPSETQLKNRKAQLRNNLSGGWEIKTPATLLEWASGRECETAADFFGAPDTQTFADAVNDHVDDLLVLRTFSHDVAIDGTDVKSFGLVFSSRNILSNVKRSIEDQQLDGILGVSDGTYKIHFGGWTLVNFGTFSTRYVRGVFSKHYVPWTFLFVRTEHTEAYRELFSTTARFAQLLFGVNLSVAFGSLDHATCIANTFSAVWPDVLLLTCWPHAARKANERSSLLKTEQYYENVIHIHLKILHEARTKEQFLALAENVLEHWRRDGEIRGLVLDNLSQNAMGLMVIKTVCINAPKLATAAVLNDSLPGVLLIAGKATKDSPFLGHFCEGPLLNEYIVRAQGLLTHTSNYLKLKIVDTDNSDTMKVAAVVFNALDFATCVENPSKGVKVTEGRMRKYVNSLSGKLVKNKPMTEAKLLYQSLHRVQVLDADHERFEVRPTWTIDDIRTVRRSYKCDCPVARQSGWVCEHIVATMTLVGKLSVDELLSVLPVRRRPGGQYKARGALARARYSQSDARFFGVTHLEQLFMESPVSPLQWNVTKEFFVKTRGSSLREHVPGQVDRWLENEGRYLWKVRFSNGKWEVMDVEELAAQVSYSHSLGLRVIP